MNITLWIAASLLAIAMLGAGTMKLVRPKDALVESGFGWARGYSPSAIKAIGTVEILGALGLIVPAVTDITPILVPIAATGLTLVMAGALATHLRRREYTDLPGPAVLLAVAIFVAIGRYGAHAF